MSVKNTMWVQSVKKDIVHTYIVPLHLSKYYTMYTGSVLITYTVLVSTSSTYPQVKTQMSTLQ